MTLTPTDTRPSSDPDDAGTESSSVAATDPTAIGTASQREWFPRPTRYGPPRLDRDISLGRRRCSDCTSPCVPTRNVSVPSGNARGPQTPIATTPTETTAITTTIPTAIPAVFCALSAPWIVQSPSMALVGRARSTRRQPSRRNAGQGTPACRQATERWCGNRSRPAMAGRHDIEQAVPGETNRRQRANGQARTPVRRELELPVASDMHCAESERVDVGGADRRAPPYLSRECARAPAGITAIQDRVEAPNACGAQIRERLT